MIRTHGLHTQTQKNGMLCYDNIIMLIVSFKTKCTKMKARTVLLAPHKKDWRAATALLPAPLITCTVTYPVSMALGMALISSEERCIAAFSIKANLLREGRVLGLETMTRRELSGSCEICKISSSMSDL